MLLIAFCSCCLTLFQFCYVFFEMVTTELHTDSSLGLTMGLYVGMMLFTVLFSVVFLVTPNFWFAFYLLLSTELTSSWKYTLVFHPLVAMVSMRSSIRMKNGNFSSGASLCTYLHRISPANLFIHYSVIQNPSTILHSLPSPSLTSLTSLTFVPPANVVTWQLTLCFRSFMRKLNTGPSTDPCATPLVTSVCSENVYPYSLFPLLQLILFQDFPSYTLAA